MSTIEKAAARLVAKDKLKKPVNDRADIGDKAGDVPDVAVAPARQAPVEVVGPAPQGNQIDKEIRGVSQPADGGANRDDKKADRQPSAALHHTCELDFEWLAENGFLVPGHNNPQQAQEFRRIKRPLLLNTQPRIAADLTLPSNVIFITSALPGEGKTFVSLNLALSLAAELDKRVLLIDGDAAKGDLSRWMSIYEEYGLVDLLTSGQAYGERASIETNVERLSVMPCGKVVDNLDELYASSLMGTLLTGLASFDKDRIIVVDGPPLIATTEAAVLARRMGQVVMVVEANKTPQSAVEQAAGQLEGCQLVSMLLNKASSSAGAGYGYGYGYGYGETDRGGREQANPADKDA